MKKIFILGVICSVVFGSGAFSATRGQVSRPGATAARAATTPTARGKTSSGTAVVQKTKLKDNVGTTNVGGTSQKQVTARAATTQKVINSGTKIAGATANTVVSEECKTKYYGCMDSFCMLDNTNGGRCLCSDRNAELEQVLAQIQKLDEQSYAMATEGVERINMGEDADEVNAMVKNIANSVTVSEVEVTKSKARKLDLSAWNNTIFDDDDDVFNTTNIDNISNKTGNDLQNAVTEICVQQIPECAANMSMLKMMYAQQIKSDCTAYENSLKQQKNESTKKLQTAQQALRDAALEQHQNQNKYDLGQCTIRFKECMQTTAGCGSDFSKCASVVAATTAQSKVGGDKKVKNYTIKGVSTSVTIAASTYDTLIAKKPMCDTVTKQCVKVKDKVWDTFIKEVAPELKSAELIAESNLRMNCIGNISECFQKACKDNMDPNDPEGSYDMCLSRPETMRSLCKVQIDPCIAAEPQIFDYVKARLASMRVDACTKEVKACLTDENRCGADYSQCVGLDTDTIIVKMCPVEKLTACNTDENGQAITGNNRQAEVYDKIDTIISGIMLNIDNSLLTQCQNALNEAMVKVCGDTESCDALVKEDTSGSRALKYEVCEATAMDEETKTITWGNCVSSIDSISKKDLQNKSWGLKLSGIIYWDKINYDENGNFPTADEYITALEEEMGPLDESDKKVIRDRVFGVEIGALKTAIDNAIKAVESDPKVQFCMTGRDVQGIQGRKLSTRGESQARFPQLTGQIRQIITAYALKNARDNYMLKYDEEIQRMMQDQVLLAQKTDAQDALDTARGQCKNWAQNSATPVTKIASNEALKWLGIGLVITAAAVVTVALGGAPLIVGASVGTASLLAGGIIDSSQKVVLANKANNNGNGHWVVDQWNYKATINTIFNEQTGICTKETVEQKCTKEKSGSKGCKKWGDKTTTTKTLQLL